jgi:hypothetical protein
MTNTDQEGQNQSKQMDELINAFAAVLAKRWLEQNADKAAGKRPAQRKRRLKGISGRTAKKEVD